MVNYQMELVMGLSPAGTPCTGFTLTATRAGRQVNDDTCKTFTISHLGVRAATDSADAATTSCW